MRRQLQMMLTLVAGIAVPVGQSRAAEEVQFPAGDLTIHADYYAPPQAEDPAAVTILLHRQQSDRSSCAQLAGDLQRSGLAVLAVDLRGHGATTGPSDKGLSEKAAKGDKRLFKSMHRDVAGAMLWLAGRDDVDLSRIGVIGFEAGGAVALNYAAKDRSIDAVVMLGPQVDAWGLSSTTDLEKLGNRRVLLVHGNDDQRTAADALASAAQSAELKACPITDDTPLEKTSCADAVVSFTQSVFGAISEEVVYASINSEVYHAAGSKSAERIALKNRRAFSSPDEAEARGLRASKQSQSQRGTDEG